MSGPYSGPGFVRFRGVTVLKVAKITFKIESGNTDVDLMLEGRDGHNRGPVKVMVGLEGAIPQGGMHIDWAAVAASGLEFPLDFVVAGEERQCAGDVRDAEITSGVAGNGWTMSYHARWLNPPSAF